MQNKTPMAHHYVSAIDVLINTFNKVIANKSTLENEAKNDNDNNEYKDKIFVPQNMAPAVLNAKYAVRGAIVKRANEIKIQCSTNNDNKVWFKNKNMSLILRIESGNYNTKTFSICDYRNALQIVSFFKSNIL